MFEYRFKDLIEQVCKPGLDFDEMLRIRNVLASPLSTQGKQQHISNTYEMWKSAQREILEHQLWLQTKDSFKKRDPQTIYVFRNLQRLMDSILWTHFGNTSDMKTIFQPEPTISDLRSHNIFGHVEAANERHSKWGEFCLIADLTSGFRSGDLLQFKEGNVTFVEVKSGPINAAITHALFQQDLNGLRQIVNKENEKSVHRQMDRIISQFHQSIEVRKGLNNEPHEVKEYPGARKSVLVVEERLQKYDSLIDHMLLRSDQQVELVEDCLTVGILNNHGETTSPSERFKAILRSNEKVNLTAGPSVDFTLFLNGTSFTRPLFMQPFNRDSVFDLACRTRSVHLHFSLPKFAEKFSSSDILLSVITGREMRKLHGKYRGASIKSGDFALKIQDRKSGKVGVLSSGLVQKMFSELFLPSELLNMNLKIINYLGAS